MTRKTVAFSVLALMLTAALACAAGAEGPVPATPTDLGCTHEHVRTTIYFFDSPNYTSIGPSFHRVSGPANVETVCLDCGETIASETVDNAVETRSHSMKKGTCALCGYREKAKTVKQQSTDRPGERTIFAQEDGKAGNLLTVTLSNEDLAALKKADVSTVLIRGNNGDAAIALKVTDALAQTETSGADLYLELAERDDGSFFAGLYLVSGPGDKTEPEDTGITLRFYQDRGDDARASVAPADSDELVRTEGVWDEDGYWSVQYLEEGTYFLLQ